MTSPEPQLLGVAALARRAFAGEDLTPFAVSLLNRLATSPEQANTRMDLATAFMLLGQADLGRFHQFEAIRQRQCFHLPASRPGGPRLLALMTPGGLMANTPLPFLLEDSDVALTMCYVAPGLPLPARLEPHDVLFNAINDSGASVPVLESLVAPLASWPRPVINPPEGVIATLREHAYLRLAGIPGLHIDATTRVERAALSDLEARPELLPSLLPGGAFPLIIRPLDSHAGHGLEKLDGPADLATYLAQHPEAAFYLSRFRDYRNPDGFFRKYRVAVLGGRSFAVHMGVSEHWMIHYLNAGMAESAWKREEEARWMASYDTDFGLRHAAAFEAIARRTQLGYFVVDCAETAAGELLVFELDCGAIVHAMDPVDLYPYKQPAMATLFAAFRELVASLAAGQPG